jgi:hypothetical protein
MREKSGTGGLGEARESQQILKKLPKPRMIPDHTMAQRHFENMVAPSSTSQDLVV